MSGSITLHKERGVNPRLTYCPRCRNDANELLLLGDREYKDICQDCGMVHFGGAAIGRNGRRCQKCDSLRLKREEIAEHEKLPASDICDACKEEIKTLQGEVAVGGIYWRCVDCRAEGVLKASTDMAKAVREEQGPEYAVKPDEAAKACGVEWGKENCPVCGPNKIV